MTDEAPHRSFRVGDVVERLEIDRLDVRRTRPDRLFGIESFLDCPSVRATLKPLGPFTTILGLAGLDLAAVEQDQPRQLDGRRRGVDRPGEAVSDEDRDEPTMVEMGIVSRSASIDAGSYAKSSRLRSLSRGDPGTCRSPPAPGPGRS